MSFKSELKEFKEFKKNYNFEYRELTEKDGEVFCGTSRIKDKIGNLIAEVDDILNVSFQLMNSLSKLLSNLFPYEIKFKGKNLACLETVFQAIKFKDKKAQNLVFKYSGGPSYHTRAASDYDWRKTGVVYWQGKPIVRDSEEYNNFIDEMYISAIANPLYRGALINTGNKYIMHSPGKTDKTESLLTRYEFEYWLNSLKDFVQSKEKQR